MHSPWLLHMWNVQILMKYRRGWTVDEPSCSFTFGEERQLRGKLQRENGNGWQAGINMSHEVICQQAVSQLDIYYIHQLALKNYECVLPSLRLPVFIFL